MANDKYPIAIITSDVHLGGGKIHEELFMDFFSELSENLHENKDLRNSLKYFIFIGDLFDLQFSSVPMILNNFDKVLKKFREINELGIKFLFVLGNHEISLTGDYDSKTYHEKLQFIKKFRDALIPKDSYNFLFNKKNICQYVLITGNRENSKWKVDLFDTEHEIKHQTPIRTEIFSPNMNHFSINCKEYIYLLVLQFFCQHYQA